MEGKAVNRVDDHRNPGKLCGEAADETRFGIVGVYDLVRICPEVTCQIEDRLEILQRVERLYQTGEDLDLHPVALDQIDQRSPRRAS